MKKIILLALTALMMVGCYNPPDYQRIDKWQILELDSCEYIQADGYHGMFIKATVVSAKNACKKSWKSW